MAKCIVWAYARIGKLYLNFLKVLIIFEIFQVLIIATDRASSDQDHISLSSELNAITETHYCLAYNNFRHQEKQDRFKCC